MAVDKFPIEAGHVMMFARAVGDDNPLYHDADYAATTECEGIVAPPTFVQSSSQFDPEYSMRPRTGQAWFGSGRSPTGAGRDPRGAVGDWAAGSTRSSVLNTTAIRASAMC